MVVEKICCRYGGEHSQGQDNLGESSEHDHVEVGNVERKVRREMGERETRYSSQKFKDMKEIGNQNTWIIQGKGNPGPGLESLDSRAG